MPPLSSFSRDWAKGSKHKSLAVTPVEV